MARSLPAVDVALVRWPAERGRRDELNGLGVPLLLLVEDGHHPPPVVGLLEDWIRVPASEADVRARIDTLLARRPAGEEVPPSLDGDGVLRANGAWVAVPPVEARLLRALLGHFGAVVARDVLSGAGWPDRSPGRNVLDVHVLRLRRRVAHVGLAIRTVRARGYLLELERPCDATASILDLTASSSPR